jgi:hypothetical protein
MNGKHFGSDFLLYPTLNLLLTFGFEKNYDSCFCSTLNVELTSHDMSCASQNSIAHDPQSELC